MSVKCDRYVLIQGRTFNSVCVKMCEPEKRVIFDTALMLFIQMFSK